MKHLTLLLVLFSVSTLYAATPQPRPDTWAQPVETANLKNFYKLDEHVYRSAQPDEAGFAYLKTLGITNILNLRDYHNDDPGPKKPGLNLYRVPMDAGKIKTADVVAALRFIKQSEGPVLIHCWHGSDRTGMISALYRIVFQNWSKEDALDELMHGGYGYHALYKNIPEFIKQADINDIKRKVFAHKLHF
jgi:protein tyrosine/serine phosphatase